MGQEIEDTRFDARDFQEFERRLRAETALLEEWIAAGALGSGDPVVGFELEACLVDSAGRPSGVNEQLLDELKNPLVVPELATFNVELNGPPQRLAGRPFSTMANDLGATVGSCNRAAQGLGATLALVGILPTAYVEDFSLRNMSGWRRYRALNEQVLRLRKGCPLRLDIKGRDRLRIEHHDVMLEAAATSFQIHLQLDPARAARAYNLSKMLSAPMVALSANSPYLFGFDLWDETRIPLFEQAVAVGASDLDKRVSFGIRYVEHSIMECFSANLARYPILLPQLLDDPVEQLSHLRLHNGTIWRWNRPLIGFDANGRPHLRLEHRVVPAGPTVVDDVANAAMYCGALFGMSEAEQHPERRLPFPTARSNFYAAARDGLGAEIVWLDGRRVSVAVLTRDVLLPLAEDGLRRLEIASDEIEQWLGIIRARLESGRNGVEWQRGYVARHGADMEELTLAYLDRQATGAPVHEWSME